MYIVYPPSQKNPALSRAGMNAQVAAVAAEVLQGFFASEDSAKRRKEAPAFRPESFIDENNNTNIYTIRRIKCLP
jgi:hypothetical protein